MQPEDLILILQLQELLFKITSKKEEYIKKNQTGCRGEENKQKKDQF